MTSAESTDEIAPELSLAALAEWGRHTDHVLRGLAHALNNRAAALSAVIELSSEPAEDPAVIRGILASEMERVRALVSVVRTIGLPRGGAEAFAPTDALPDVRMVLEMHAGLRDNPPALDATDAPPVRVRRWMFMRLLVALAASARAEKSSGPPRIELRGDGDWLVIAAPGDGMAAPLSPLVQELARAMEGAPLEGRYGVRIPTLAALRRREGR